MARQLRGSAKPKAKRSATKPKARKKRTALDVVRSYLDERNFNYEVDGEQIRYSIEEENGTYRYFIHASERASKSLVIVSAYTDQAMPHKRRGALAEAVIRLNTWIDIGNFDLEPGNELCFRTGIDLGRSSVTSAMVSILIGAAERYWQAYGEALMKVAYDKADPTKVDDDPVFFL